MEYWIIVNEERVGPLTIEALKEYDLKADTPVWYVGLEDWIQANQVAELAELLNSEAADVEENQDETITEDIEAEPASEPEQEKAEPTIVVEEKPLRPCPPSYLVWAVLVIVLCCAPLGIPAIIYSSQVKTKYNNGDYSGARKASDRAALWVILAFVGGLIYQPFSGLLSILWASLQGAI
ncbi:MAG: CD225/dispanin family protein [Muribaculaceae bacterium]|nr:CD225/dispanin family protein [Muribaculaceae bacterium]